MILISKQKSFLMHNSLETRAEKSASADSVEYAFCIISNFTIESFVKF